ncbi:tRNA pseudouridine synthase B [Caldicellulosiruptor kronotskyensis 2002]|uniref:tRNA pseudouridine synthase B n=1 Tax=Caldicellulosiruptor kronotskyensis (strain DSM 18902 / VKM B-2412 / 2002) TaxID=632348 RepID=E4SFG7_CALK2|nr:tRNA pseudouridine(55) synthase TruB [Caldicellulosiruptor kronotskyensis]ADQ46492.1 tRNA pseudouridine synthase B [Caldicellulosiruptor kronotskyensis 2002]
MNGVLLVDKPVGITSHDVVEFVRKVFSVKAGHAGTLDPFATGLLVILLGEATKLSSYFTSQEKTYIATMQFGIRTDTLDITGKIKEKNNMIVEEKEIEECFKNLKGEIELDVPIFSAKKLRGKKLYEYARKGINIEIPKVKSIIYNIEIINFSYPYLEFKVQCSHGTYIRSLAEKIAESLSTVGLLSELRRIKSGFFDLKDAVALTDIREKSIIPVYRLFKNEIKVGRKAYKKILNGNLLVPQDIEDIIEIDTAFADFYKIWDDKVVFIYKRERDVFKYILKVETADECL